MNIDIRLTDIHADTLPHLATALQGLQKIDRDNHDNSVNKMLAAFDVPVPGTGARIKYEDRPDVGAPLPVLPPPPAEEAPAPALDLSKVGFGQSPVGAAPLAPPPAPPATSAAAQAGIPSPTSGPAMTAPAAAAPAPVPSINPAAMGITGAAQVPPPPSTTPGGAELDKDGLPWDERIHASTKTKNKDGTWRQKRELPDGRREQVEAELRHLMSLNAGAAPATVDMAALHASPQSAPAQVPAAPGLPQVTPGTVMEALTPAMMSGKISTQQVNEVAQKHGMGNISQLVFAPNLAAAVWADLQPLLA